MDLLRRYPWPGNVRELRNAMDYAAAMSAGPRVDAPDLPEEIRAGPKEAELAEAQASVLPLAEVERLAIFGAIQACGGSRAKAASTLGIGLATLYRKLQLYAQAH